METLVLTPILLAVVALFVTRWLPVEVASMLIPPALVFSGLLDWPSFSARAPAS